MHHLSGGQASDALFSAKGFVTVALGRAKEPPRPAQEARATRAAANMHGVKVKHLASVDSSLALPKERSPALAPGP